MRNNVLAQILSPVVTGKQTIGIADMRISANENDVLVTYGLGSCIGVSVYDPVAGVGGLLHALLPAASLDVARAKVIPPTFVDTGLTALLEACYRQGAQKHRLVVTAAGGAARNVQHGTEDHFQIGRRNFLALRQALWKHGVILEAYDVGGHSPRTMSLAIGTGEVTISRYDNV
jgi:chemotaxis protein CheD